MIASGFAGLGYQIIWTQQSALWLGHEAASVLAVVCAFFGGLAVGAFATGGAIERSRRPRRWYVACELLIALWSGGLLWAFEPASHWLIAATGVTPSPLWQWTVAFGGTFLLLLPATAAMGATLPAMERLIANLHGTGRSIALLYAANTLGAVLGVLACAFWLVPGAGLARTTLLCVALNVGCATLAFLRMPRQVDPPAPRIPVGAIWVSGALLLTGLLGIAYEVLVVRVLSQVSEDTVYTYALLLAVYLIGTSLGAAGYQQRRPGGDENALSGRLLMALGAACLASGGGLWLAERVKTMALASFGHSVAAALGAELTLAILAFAPPAAVMGALFSHLSDRAQRAGLGYGRALGINTLGAAAAPALVGVLGIPALGPKWLLVLLALGYLALVPWRDLRRPLVWLCGSAAVAVGVFARPLAFVDIPPGGRLVAYVDGVMAAVSVVEDANGIARLRINNRQQEGTSASLRVDGRQALLPLLLHPAPRHALFLGLGTGVTASTAATDGDLEVDADELVPEVIAVSTRFTRPLNGDSPNPRLHVSATDARRYVRATANHYEVIVADNFHPARSGSGALYTLEHFGAVKARLTQAGLFCQWLPLHQLDLATLASITRTFLQVFPHGAAMLANNGLDTPVIGLVGRRDDGRFEPAAVAQRLASAHFEHSPSNFGLEDPLAVLGSFIAGPTALARFAGDAPLNTDDLPVVAYQAPRITYAPDSLPRDRLLELLTVLQPDASELLEKSDTDTFGGRLAAYWHARDRFIAAGRHIQPTQNPHEMLAQIEGPLLEVLRISPDFRPAYDPLLAMARSLAGSEPDTARALLVALESVQPERSEAGALLRELDGQPAPSR